jgi:hypothetical protein
VDDFEEKLNTILSSPETMGQIMALANSLSGQPGQSPTEPAPPSEGENASPAPPSGGENPLGLLQSIDPAMIQKIMNLYGEYMRGGDEKVALLQAMRPFLREERQSRLDKAIQIARISRVIQAALKQFRGGNDRDV